MAVSAFLFARSRRGLPIVWVMSGTLFVGALVAALLVAFTLQAHHRKLMFMRPEEFQNSLDSFNRQSLNLPPEKANPCAVN
jgi:hypothetical protein